MANFWKSVGDRIPIPDDAVTACNWLKRNYRGCIVSLAIILGVGGLVVARGDLSSPRIAFAHADAKAMAQGIFGGMKDKLGEMARGIEAALAENAKTNAEVSAVKGRVTKIEQAPTMTADDLSREIKVLMDSIELKINQKVPMSEYQNDKKLLDQKVSMLQSIIDSVVGKANAEPAPQQPQSPPAQPATPAEAGSKADNARYEQVIKSCPTLMAGWTHDRNKLSVLYAGMSEKDFESVMQECRRREAKLLFPRPEPKLRDLAFREKERQTALNRVPICSFGTFSKEKGKCI
jgi:hypothetical protein